jgi:hypothetical protein
MFSDDHSVVRQALCGKAADEKVLASLSALEEKLERLKQISPAFANVSFSPQVERLIARNSTVV